MEIKQLRAFITICETKNITKAANLLNIVQPAVTRQIHLLEEELGIKLFERGRHGVNVTSEGKILESYARRIIREIDQARNELTTLDETLSGTINIGILASLSELLSINLVRMIKAKYPLVNLRISIGYSGHLKEWLEAGDLDMALVYGKGSSKFIETSALVREHLWLIGPANAKLDRIQPVLLKDIGEFEYILPYLPHNLRSLIEQGFNNEKLPLKIAAEINDLYVQKQLVKEGFGYTILPLVSVQQDLANQSVAVAPIEHPDFIRDIVLAIPATRHVSKLTHVIAKEVKLFSKQAVNSGLWTGSEWIGT